MKFTATILTLEGNSIGWNRCARLAPGLRKVPAARRILGR